MKAKEWIVVFVDKDTIKAEKINAYSANIAMDYLILKRGVLNMNILMVVENSGNGAFCVETVKGLLDCGTISFDSAEVKTGDEIETNHTKQAIGACAGCRTPESLAEKFHTLYEGFAPEYGYKTRDESAVPWEAVPEQNKKLMIRVCKTILGGV